MNTGTVTPDRRWRPQAFQGVIYDVGMHDGTDTALYLTQGYAVVAIDADPVLASAGIARFADAIARGQLTILNIGISAQTGEATFWICDDHSVWNSFDVRIASRNGATHHALTIPTRRFRDVLDEFGVPLYLKVDIEGADGLCVRDLDRQQLPQFISVESECAADGEHLTEADALRMLDLLRDAGYTRFKLVSQDNFTTVPDPWRRVRQIVDSAVDGKLRVLHLAPLLHRYATRVRLARRNGGQSLVCGNTGPWGEGLLGRWQTYAQARDTYLRLRARFFADSTAITYAFWYDWHATH